MCLVRELAIPGLFPRHPWDGRLSPDGHDRANAFVSDAHGSFSTLKKLQSGHRNIEVPPANTQGEAVSATGKAALHLDRHPDLLSDVRAVCKVRLGSGLLKIDTPQLPSTRRH